MVTEFDFILLNFIRDNLSGNFLDYLMKFITHLGDGGGIWVISAITLLCFRKTRRAGIWLAIALAVAAVLGDIVLKNIFTRMRPFAAANVPIIINPPGSYSFPSGHTGSSFAAATVLSGFYKKWAVLFYTVAALIAFSRVYLYVHYPSDIVGGVILGTFVGISCIKLKNRW